MKKTSQKIALIAGARPNFMKVAPLVRELENQKIKHFLINTGQHFSKDMAADFFREFKIKPDYSLHPSQKSTTKQFADILVGIEEIFTKEKPNVVAVVGDVNSTLAGALTANKMGIKLAHVEAGLRSYNNKMPEEINRVIIDRLSDLLFVPSEDAVKNLHNEGVTKNIKVVGNIMIDTMALFLDKIPETQEKFFFCTLHRAENVDDREVFENILAALQKIAKQRKIYLTLHPRTKKRAEEFGLLKKINKIFTILPPL
ncbi:MAG: UDP-N-acetylglucosamine 2-epimerase (non-hydrolyzing), partial [bacterium]|nr:UDP-N-acetylglucosamine 2-epimerase (non-hydrolyzing) [bacterium]